LLWAAIGLVVLVLFIPLTSHQKAGKEVAKKPPVDKGKVVKEIPRSLQPIAESLSRGQGEPADTPKEADSKPGASSDGKGAAPPMSATAPSTPTKEKPVEPPAGLPKAETVGEAGPKNPGNRPTTPEPAASHVLKETPSPPTSSDGALGRKAEPATPAPTETKPKTVASVQAPGKPAKPAATEAGAAGPPAAAGSDTQKPGAGGGKTLYTVQIATLKDKTSAEELKKSLQKKGFDVVMKTTGDPKQGQSFTLQLQPVDNMGKASTLMEQVKYVPQTKPSIVTVSKE
jgi:hypothetical protein